MAHIRINLLLRSLSFCFTLLIGLAASAQVDNVYVYGQYPLRAEEAHW